VGGVGVGIGGGLLLRVVAFVCAGGRSGEGEEVIVGREAFSSNSNGSGEGEGG